MHHSDFISKRITSLLFLVVWESPVLAHVKSPKSVVKPLEIMVEDAAPPWSGADGKGYANDVVKAVYKEVGVPVVLKVVPYARCKKTVLKGQAVACFSMAWHDEFDGLLKLASEPLIYLNVDVFESIKRPLPKPAQGTCDIPPNTRVGTVRAYEYPPEAMALVTRGAIFETYHSDIHTLKMLASGRIDAAIIMTNELEPRNTKSLEAKTDQQVRFAFNCGKEAGTIGFSLTHPLGLLAWTHYEEGYKRLKKKGTLRAIAEKWGDNRTTF
ncbi:MAG TPA: transporter substrate-binding domain-containing protein [Oligoflexus sp.]|uniref:transporter substrate-binding domain-containing protein n=1 Tax=Oligoflexus sp. TaxID=1971216 RepID=UPI002D6826C0|nr:transporter substrate-binding domain-containing protein [Oligoflexus sp.]HYX38105.1 transporter substrate-binding domain-containing protein [Oligoflexus sp.]